MLTEVERAFWLALRCELNNTGYELLVSGPVILDFDFDVPYIYLPTKLDFYTSIPDVCCVDDDMSSDRYLKREDEYYGAGDNEVRKHGVQVISSVFDSLLDSLNIAFVLVGNGNHAVDMILLDKVKERNISHMIFERGPFPNMWHLDGTGMTAGTDAAQRSDCEWFDDAKWLQVFKDYENYYKSQKNTWWHQPDTKSDVRKLFNIPKNKKIILFANQLDNDTSNFLYAPLHETNLDALKWLCEQLEPYKDEYFILGKHHPVNSVSMDEFQSVVGGLGVWTNEVALDDALMQSDYVCAVNSTLLYEALIYRKPCLMLGKAILSGKDIVYEIISLEKSHVESTMNDWLGIEDKDAREAKWFNLGASLLSDCLYSMNLEKMNLPLKGTKNFADEIVGRCDRDVTIKNSSSFVCFYNMLSSFYEHRFLTPTDKNILKLVATCSLFQEILLRIKSKLGIIKR
jgi:hypothetical protein